jgi:site-specific DNA recombinase
VIEVEPDTGPRVTRLFEWYSTGMYSLKQAAARARADGMTFRGSAKPISTSSVHKILRSRIYTGEFEWIGKRYQGLHEPLVSIETWERVQGVLDGRHTARVRGIEKDFLFTGMIRCGHCGCALVGDIKKEKYIYYRCSHGKGKCPEPYVREEVLLEQLGDMLDRVTLSSEMFEWLRAALRESFAHVHKEHDDAVSRLQTERERLRERLKQIYMDNLDGRIEDEVYNALTVQFRDQERKVAKELERRHDADLSYFDDGIALLSVARDSKQRFLAADSAAKKHVLSAVLSNCSFRDRQLSAEYRKPFDILVEKSPGGDAAGKRTRRKKGESPQWQGRSDSNRGPSVLETDALTS